jgi:hypothetical protein
VGGYDVDDRENDGTALQKCFSNRESRYACNLPGGMQAARQRRRQLGGDGSIIRVTLDRQADHFGRAFDGRNDRCAMARPRGAASGFDNGQHSRSGVEDLKVYVVDDGLETPASI